jgi:hypothetical protein
MILEDVLLQLLTTGAPSSIETKLNGDIHFGVVPHHRNTYIRISNVSNPQSERNSTGAQHSTKRSTFQIDVFARHYLFAKELSTDIAEHLDAYQGTHDDLVIQLIEVEDMRPGFANTTETHQHIIDIAITHRRKEL